MMGTFVSCMKYDKEMVGGVNVRPANASEGASPSGKRKSPPGWKDTMARMIRLLIAVCHPAAPGLVVQVDRKASAEEDGLEALAPVGRRLPRLGGLAVTVPEDEGQSAGVGRHLI